ncbi:hypothetical protein V2J09_004822 [Rumex salicifolius]
MAHLRLVLILLISIHVTSIYADSIHGCGGFVEANRGLIKSRKPSDAKLDYSHITVELQTVDGLVKDWTQCAPNGYYFIPVYDKGSFVIKVKGPEGWSWDPDKVPVVIDHSGCNANEDINFRFTGFALSGRVIGAVGGKSCPSKNGGPAGVTVELLSSTDEVISSILTSSDGEYSFKNVIPGNYKLRASHPKMEIEVRSPAEVELGFANGRVDDIFFAPGYEIHGLVVAQGNPILGVHMYLYSDDVAEVHCPQGSGNAPGQRKALCHAVTDAEGKFTFKSIPCGAYDIVPYYKGENTIFDVSPPSVSIFVQHDHLMVPQTFQVTGFSIGGRVVDGNGVGVDGAKVIVNGKERSITDINGYYKLDQVTSKNYKIEAVKRHYKFSTLKDFLVLPNKASIPDIEAVAYDVCGTVKVADVGYKAKVALTHGPENVKPQMKLADERGNFCFEVSPGEYRLSALAAAPERTPELVFLPPYTDVVVRSPLHDIEFSQALVSLHGRVVCIDKCSRDISVKLNRLGSKSSKHLKTVHLSDESSEFVFPDVLPGKYRLEVKHASTGSLEAEDKWCWEQSFIDIDAAVENVEGIVFSQKGYWVKVISSHNVDARITQPDGEPMYLKIKKGSQSLCLLSPGIHELQFVNSCILFESSPVKIDTSNPTPVILKGEKYLLKGKINIDQTSLGGHELPENLVVDVLDNKNDVLDSIFAKLSSDVNDETSAAAYEYSVWANLGQKVTFVPKDQRNGGGRQILFYPRQLEVPVTRDACQEMVPSFSGRMGLYIDGSVTPPISGVSIRIVAAGNSPSAQLKKGEVALETKTDADGVFVGGPLYDDIKYTVVASKPGYHLKSEGPTSFSCQKLGQISIHLFSKEDTNEPFPSALLSLSGEDGYRNNSVTKTGGSFVFDNLFPGSFYLRPLLKEYAFHPRAEAIELASGESKEIVFEATRVAYSAMGVVTLLSGQPKEGISIEARSETKGFYEEAVTDSSGYYRLRGLQPDTTYSIQVVKRDDLTGSRIERSSPESVAIHVGLEDIKGLDFLAFEQPEKTIVSCHVEGEGFTELDSHLHVEVRSASVQSKVESVFPLPLSRFFQVKDLPKGKHLLQLRSSLPLSTHRFISEAIEVDLDDQSQLHVGPLRYRIEEDILKHDLTAAPLMPIVVGLSVIIIFISMPRLKDLYQSASTSSGSNGAVKKDIRKPVLRKKTF